MSFNPNLSGTGKHASGSRSSHNSQRPPAQVPPITQATNLPKESPATLLCITKLTPQSSTTTWGNEVIHVLRPFKLESLVNSDLPKPQPGDGDYHKWKYWTRIVASWLFHQVDVSIQRRLKENSNEITYADELFKTIKELCLFNQSEYVAREVQKWEGLKRGDYPTPADFIMAYQNQFNRLKTENHEPTCGFAIGRLLAELDGEILRVPFIREEVRDLGRPVDYQLFTYYCRVLISESRKPDTGNILPGSHATGSGRGLGRDVSYRGWRESTKGKRPEWD